MNFLIIHTYICTSVFTYRLHLFAFFRSLFAFRFRVDKLSSIYCEIVYVNVANANTNGYANKNNNS